MPTSPAPGGPPRRLCAYSAGLLRPGRVRRILELAGHEVALGLPRPGDGVAVWGRSPQAWRGEAVAARRRVALVRIEDAFLRSIRPGRAGEGPLGLMIDPEGVHFDASAPSRLEGILARHPLDDAVLLGRARDGIARLRHSDLSKYNLHDPAAEAPAPGYVLVVDQVRGDASLGHSGAPAGAMAEMLAAAREAHPRTRIVVKAHPEAMLGLRPGHWGADTPGVTVVAGPVSPWRLIEGAVAVYTVSSLMGFEAILAGHRPRVWGQPFYAGWGLSEDMRPPPRRGRRLTRVQLFAAAMILAPVWHDPCRDRLCTFEEAVDQLEAEVRRHREDRRGHVAAGMRLWKRRHLQRFFGHPRRLVFRDDPAAAAALAARRGRDLMVWAGRAPADLAVPPGVTLRWIEDGFLRSRGLGAELVAPLSLIADTRGVHYDPARPSDLEVLIRRGPPPGGVARAERLMARLVGGGLTKYNLGGGLPALPPGPRVLVAGQVEDDAALRLGATGAVRTNLDLLRAARAARPGATIVFKPHPDVEAGLRPGAVPAADLAALADVVAAGADPAALVAACDEVWTMTSLLGFEALMRGRPVTCLGAPFYAGWGLTRDLGPVPERRCRGPDGQTLPPVALAALVHAALIAAPRCRDPVSGLPCPPEVLAERLAARLAEERAGGRSGTGGSLPRRGPLLRVLAKAQGVLASRPGLWR